ncbi:hypothetical protein HYR69_10660, partial [Candidatus Sumerlaeota bacterium]|nr:hypothetical protein [Candidatus Sumerlaeota bacterium]
LAHRHEVPALALAAAGILGLISACAAFLAPEGLRERWTAVAAYMVFALFGWYGTHRTLIRAHYEGVVQCGRDLANKIPEGDHLVILADGLETQFLQQMVFHTGAPTYAIRRRVEIPFGISADKLMKSGIIRVEESGHSWLLASPDWSLGREPSARIGEAGLYFLGDESRLKVNGGQFEMYRKTGLLKSIAVK